MTRPVRLLIGAVMGSIVTVAVVLSATVGAGTIEPHRGPYAAVSSLTDQAAYNGGIWTGWISMEARSDICFEILQDYTGNTGVTMRCEVTDDRSTADDGGADITAVDIAGGTATSVLLTWSHQTGTADAKWIWCVDDVPGEWISCLFDDKAGDNATDDLTVRYSLQGP